MAAGRGPSRWPPHRARGASSLSFATRRGQHHLRGNERHGDGGGGAEVLRSVDAGVTWAAAGMFEDAMTVVPTRPATMLAQPASAASSAARMAARPGSRGDPGLPPDAGVTHVASAGAARRRSLPRPEAGAFTGVRRRRVWTPTGHADGPRRSGQLQRLDREDGRASSATQLARLDRPERGRRGHLDELKTV